jgi:hypothetical protein
MNPSAKLKHPDVACAVHEDRQNGVVAEMGTFPRPRLLFWTMLPPRWIKAGLNILMLDYNHRFTRLLFAAGNSATASRE